MVSGTASGSGVIVETQPLGAAIVVTNLHVVDQGDRVTVQVNDTKTLSAVFLGYDAQKDLAVLKVCCDPNLQSSPLATLGISPGELVFAMGYPLGINQASVTGGIVSRVAYDQGTERWMVQTDAPINPGNSGGPLFTLDGEIAGINTSVVRESSSGTSVEGFGLAVSARTVLNMLPSLMAGTIGSPPTPTATPVPTPRPIDDFGPVDGSLMHDPADGLIETEYANISFRDLMVSATFINPYAATTHDWDYGFILDGGPSTEKMHIVVMGDRRWSVLRGTETPRERIGGGTIKTFRTGVEETNQLSLVVVGERGWFLVNGEFISSFDLSSHSGAWDVAVMTGEFTSNELFGKSTGFEDFEGTRLIRQYGPASGDFEMETDSVLPQHSGVEARDFVAEANFVSSQRDDWFYGFWFRYHDPGRIQAVWVANWGYDEHWNHVTWDRAAEEWVDVGDGFLSTVGAKSSSRNHMLLIALADYGWLFVNNLFVANLDLRDNQELGLIFAHGAPLEGHHATIQFEDFNVWAP